jgi:hypothetical protein
MDVDDVRLSGDSVLPPSPSLARSYQKFTYFWPLAGSPEEIHPERIPVAVVTVELFRDRGIPIAILADRPGDTPPSLFVIDDNKIVVMSPPDPEPEIP